jgi:hypothetical protein
MLRKVIAGVALLMLATRSGAQAPDECFGFTFGKWDPPLKTASSTYSPGYDPTSSAPAGTPPSWAMRTPTSDAAGAPADSVLLLFPPWWPAGVAIQWTTQHGDTLTGVARALVADGRVKNPESAVRALRIPCHSSTPGSRPAPDTTSYHS